MSTLEAVGPLQNGAEHCLAVVPRQAPGAGSDGTPLEASRESREIGAHSFRTRRGAATRCGQSLHIPLQLVAGGWTDVVGLQSRASWSAS